MKICLAGTGGLKNNQEALQDVPYILESFYYIKDWQIPLIKKCDLFLLDSGAFTMFSKGKQMTEKDWDDYLTQYIAFINKYDVKYFFELDIDRLVGIKKVEEYRKRIERETGKKCIPVWHKERGWKYFEWMCKEYDYVAIGGIAKNPNGKQIEKLFPYFIDYAHKHKCKIHGLGYTSSIGFKKYKFDSVDSTTWINGGRYGNVAIFKDGIIKQEHYADKRCYDVNKLTLHNLNEWKRFQRWAKINL